MFSGQLRQKSLVCFLLKRPYLRNEVALRKMFSKHHVPYLLLKGFKGTYGTNMHHLYKVIEDCNNEDDAFHI